MLRKPKRVRKATGVARKPARGTELRVVPSAEEEPLTSETKEQQDCNSAGEEPTAGATVENAALHRVDSVVTEGVKAGYVELLLRGASPVAAATRLGVDLFAVVEEIAEDEAFRMRVDAAYDALSQNVAARLYQEAMQGSVTAMTFWLRHRPPPEWPDYQARTSERESGWEQMSDEELLRQARLEQVEIPAELEASLAAAGGDPRSGVVPPGAEAGR